MRKGSITIFSVLAMMLTASVLFTLIEAARFQELKRVSELQTELAVESVFANYNKSLWENYHLLGCDYTEAETILIESGNGRLEANKNGLNLLVSSVDDANITGYTLLTDGEGAAYIKTVSSYMKENFLYETAKDIYNQYEVLKSIKDSGQMDLANIEVAIQSLSSLQEEAASMEREESLETTEVKNEDSTKVSNETTSYVGENPLEEVKELQNLGILELVVENSTQISQKEIGEEVVSQRELLQGKNASFEQVEWLDKVLLQQYLLSYLNNYCEDREQDTLCYELEYIIGGKSSDAENLKVVVTQLLGIREITNFLYLTADATKVEEAGILAMALAGASANPLVIEAVKVGLLTAWAFGESVLDVRALLQGKKIPLLKNAETWTLELTSISGISDSYVSAKNCEWGFSYKDYVGILLLFQKETTLAMRSMDVQEMVIRSYDGEEDFRMDELMVGTEVEMTYTGKPLFLSLSTVAVDDFEDWKISITADYGYDGRQVIRDVP